jgi:hypothetical protein
MSVQSAQAAVDSADLALKQAEEDLDNTKLRAPMAGTVASISGDVGDTVGSGSSSNQGQGANSSAASSPSSSSSASSAFIVLAALSKLKLDVSLSESDIGKVAVGQSATVTINAASGEQVAGHVTAVGILSDSSSSSSGAVSYPVTVTLDQSTQGIKAGMSATADIVVARASGIVVPSQAVRANSVTVVKDGRRSTQRVQTGVVGDSSTQIVSGLNAGDQVIVTSTSVRSTGTGTTGTTARTGLGGAGGFGGAAGFGGGTGATRRFGGGSGFGGAGPGGPGG